MTGCDGSGENDRLVLEQIEMTISTHSVVKSSPIREGSCGLDLETDILRVNLFVVKEYRIGVIHFC